MVGRGKYFICRKFSESRSGGEEWENQRLASEVPFECPP